MKWDAILEHCSFDYMKQHATKSVPLGAVWDGGAQTFIYRALTVDGAELWQQRKAKYEQIAKKQLGKRVHIGHRNLPK